jgi:hypothetical protein
MKSDETINKPRDECTPVEPIRAIEPEVSLERPDSPIHGNVATEFGLGCGGWELIPLCVDHVPMPRPAD